MNECHRWLNNDQAAADSANFMRNVKFEGIDEDLTAPHTPWIYYGVRGQPHTSFVTLSCNRAPMQVHGQPT